MPSRSGAVLVAACLLTSPLVATAQTPPPLATAPAEAGAAKPANPDQEATPRAAAPAAASTGAPAAPGAVPAPGMATAAPPAGTTVLSRRLEPVDRRFLEDAAQGGLREIEFGKLAAQQATDPAVKSFGELMAKEHAETSRKLTALAQGKGLAAATQLAPADAKQLDALRKLSGARFDKAYIDVAVRGHVIEVKSFDRQAKATRDPDVRTFATDASPIVHRHLDLASDVQKHLGKPPPAPMTPKNDVPMAAKGDAPVKGDGPAVPPAAAAPAVRTPPP